MRSQYNAFDFVQQRFQVSSEHYHNLFQKVTNYVFPILSIYCRLVMRTTVNVKEGEQLYITYTYILSGTHVRQEVLKKGKFFSCKCERCQDPTELNTNFDSILCRKCEGGVIVSTNPLGKLS